MKKILSAPVPRHLTVHLQFEDGFEDGFEGDLDLSGIPHSGVFSAWKDPCFFKQVSVGDRGRSLEWPTEIDLCADSLWLELSGQDPEMIYPGLQTSHA